MILENFFAVNETSMSPRSPALAIPKAPQAPAAPTLEEEDRSIDPDLVNQIYLNNQDIIGNNPNLIKPGQVLSLPDGSSYAVQRGDNLSKIAKKIQTPSVAPVVAVPAQVPMGTHSTDRDPVSGLPNWKDPNPIANPKVQVWPNAGNLPPAVAPVAAPSLVDKLKRVASGEFVSNVFPELTPKGSRAAPPSVMPSSPAPAARSAAAAPEMVPAADSMAPGEEIVTAKKSKLPVVLPKHAVTPTPSQPNVIQRIEKGAADKAGQVGNWLAGLVKKRESGDDYDIGHHYAPGTGSAGPDNRKTTAWGAYGLTNAAILAARGEDATLQKPLKQWTPEDQDRAFNIVNDKNLKRMDQLGVDINKHPEAPSIAIFLGADGAAKYYKTGKFNQDTMDANGGEEGVKKIIAQRTKDSLAALEKQKKQRVKETVNTVNTMLKTASTADDVRHIRNYIDRQYTRHGLLDQVAFAQRSHLVERVIEITNQRQLLAR